MENFMDIQQYLTFLIHGEEYAVSIVRVREIIEYESVTRVPTAPPHVRGVLNLRGAVTPVVDLAAKFGHGEIVPSRKTCIVVVEIVLDDELLSVGLLADAVSEVVDIAAADIVPTPSFGTRARIDFLSGMGKLAGRLVLVLDIDRILSPVEVEETIDAINNDAVAEAAQL
jgi:purine-binding chemotaxis protein CheW